METNTEQLSIIADGWQHKDTPTFEELSASILQTHQSAQTSAIKAVNQMATCTPHGLRPSADIQRCNRFCWSDIRLDVQGKRQGFRGRR